MSSAFRIAFVIFGIFIAVLFLLSCGGHCSPKYLVLEINGVSFRLEVADTQEKREAGLSGRILKDDEGMLFVFERPCRPVFWMKGCLEPLDIIWVDENLKVSGIEEKAPVCADGDHIIYRPSSKIKYAIELKGGAAERTGIVKGQRVAGLN